MSKKVLERLKAQFGDRILATSSNFGDDEAVVAPKDWLEVATFLRDDPECEMNHFVDVTCVDYPMREDLPRFDVLVFVRSLAKKHRVRLKTRVDEGGSVPSLVPVWIGANWGEREAWDMFGVVFEGHPDPRRILLYEEFVGHPLRKDYPIEKTQPLVPYRDVEDIDKLPPFGADEGQPWSRIDWQARIEGSDFQVSPAIGEQQGQRPALSRGTEYTDLDDEAARTATE
ncbi:NADH-quinone oxidoreductase subunit C [Sandaracinus amylolyticus]|uniref:NADH-quinone oxidoreductase subunit C n=1 Tax=Sandaracinus amylolyticus TaxID=927083 RepID=UPI001F17A92D|nr:NADH-quinone oxidoreductase subunit C [Sandaracinus amylolyticus]UJR79269.1 NADH-quinone oxidoreductase subunit C [Sandaracinus amylolyticus]